MITKERLMNGLLSYVDAEVIPKLPTSGKIVVGTAVCLMAQGSTEVIDQLLDNKFVLSMRVIDKNGLIDAERLLNGLYSSTKKYGNLEIVIPIIGTLTFAPQDVIQLKSYICTGENNHDQ